MKLTCTSPARSLNKAYLKQSVKREQIELFKTNLARLFDRIRNDETEEHLKNIVADFLKDVAIVSGPLIASQTGFSAAQREAIAFAYQFGTLILPTVVPAVLWVLLHRQFLEKLREAGRPAGS